MENLSVLNHKSCKMSMMHMQDWSIWLSAIFVNFKFIYIVHLNKQKLPKGCFFVFFLKYIYSSLLCKVEVTIVEIFRHSLIDLKPCSTENQIFTTKFNVLNILAAKFLFVFIHFIWFFFMEDCVYPGGLLQLISPTLFLCHTFTPIFHGYKYARTTTRFLWLIWVAAESWMVIRLILHERSMWVIRRQRILVIYYWPAGTEILNQ